jgi:hypothetical protein
VEVMGFYTSDNPAHLGTVVFLDGVKISDVIECHTDKGWLVRYKRNPEGELEVIKGFIQKEILRGVVTVREP